MARKATGDVLKFGDRSKEVTTARRTERGRGSHTDVHSLPCLSFLLPNMPSGLNVLHGEVGEKELKRYLQQEFYSTMSK